MAVFRPMNRMISFRLPEEEYEFLRKQSLSHDARSVSDYARSALRRLIAGQARAPSDDFQASIQQLDRQMQELNREIRQLLQEVEQRAHGLPPRPSP